MDEIKLDIIFGTVELHEAPPRIEGRYLIPRGRTIERDRHGKVTRDETYDIGVRIENWEECAHLFGVQAPPKPTPLQRLRAFLK